MKKRIIYIALSAVFLALSALGIGWLVRQEIEKGKRENQNRDSAILRKEGPGEIKSQNSGADAEVIVKNKEQASKALDDVEELMNSAEEGDFAKERIDNQ